MGGGQRMLGGSRGGRVCYFPLPGVPGGAWTLLGGVEPPFSRGEAKTKEGADSELLVPMAQNSSLWQRAWLTCKGPAGLLEYSSLSLSMQPVIPDVPVALPSHQGSMQITAG